MITNVTISTLAQKQLRKVPMHVANKLRAWVRGVSERGVEEMRMIPGYHDEPLRGQRRGQRSIRLSRSFRAIYEVRGDFAVEYVSIEEVNKHDY